MNLSDATQAEAGKKSVAEVQKDNLALKHAVLEYGQEYCRYWLEGVLQ